MISVEHFSIARNKMKINVKVEEEWFVIPCGSKKKEILWLKEEAVKRFNKYSVSRSNTPVVFYSNECELRITKTNGILDDDDTVQDVLNDKDFVALVEKKEKVDRKSLKRKNPVSVQPHGHQDNEESSVKPYIALDGCSLTTDDLVKLGTGKYAIKLTEESRAMVNKGRQLLEDIVKENRVAYGVNTGFGKFAQVIISKDKLMELQENLIRSHAVGTGDPLTINRTRMLLALRINVLAKGYSGISESTLDQYITAFNRDACTPARGDSMLPMVPEQGTVGASGDLAPLSHLALGIALGEGKMWSPRSGWADASLVLEAHGMKPFCLKPKEGIALINGTQLITALGAEALERANAIAKQADIIAALSLEVLKGSTNAFDIDIQRVRPHKGQGIVAERLRSVLHSEIHPSEIAESHRFCNRVQDAYTLRCCPQVHGIVNDTIDFVRGILTTEMNSATDNPIVFADRGVIMSGGNFHGEYPAKALDYLAIGVHELASMSERRMERLMNPAYSELPAFLCKDGGLNSGFMMMHCTAASLVSENKVLCHPSSVDSLSTSAGQEDHVSMGGFSARKALKVVENVEKVLTIELLCACQGIEFLRPLKTTQPLESVHALVRSVAKPLDKDRYMVPDMKAVTDLLLKEKVWESAFPFYRKYQHESSMDHHEDQIFKSPSTSVVSPDDNAVNKKRKTESETVVKTC